MGAKVKVTDNIALLRWMHTSWRFPIEDDPVSCFVLSNVHIHLMWVDLGKCCVCVCVYGEWGVRCDRCVCRESGV